MDERIKKAILEKLGLPTDEETYWKYKIVSFLHDPPEKMLYINKEISTGHEIVAETYRKSLDDSINEIYSKLLGQIKSSDQNAAGFDRFLNLADQKESINLQRVNPLSGEWHKIWYNKNDFEDLENLFKDLSAKFENDKEKFKKIFYSLYMFLPDLIKEKTSIPNFDPFDLLADTRIADHSIFDHIIATSAISVSISDVSFLQFAIGPVQSFIQTARKTQDFFMGSYLLSYLTFQGIQKVVELLGPDNIVYPDLRVQPLFKKWLKESMFKGSNDFDDFLNVSEEELKIANIPNTFLVIIPDELVKDIAEAVNKEINSKWVELSSKVKNKLNIQGNGYFDQLWKREIDTFPGIYWVVLPWAKISSDGNEIKEYFKGVKTNLIESGYLMNLFETLKSDDVIYRVESEIFQRDIDNSGKLYSLYFQIINKLLASRKLIREFKTEPEPGYKCDICGEREVLSGRESSSYEEVKQFWDRLHKNFSYKFKEKEKLCAVCTVKRLAQDFASDLLFREDIKEEFPPTSEIANISFKSKLFKNMKKDESFHDNILKYIKKFSSYDENSTFKSLYRSSTVPKLEEEFKEATEYLFDPLWFDEDYLSSKGITEDYPYLKDKLQDIRNALKGLKEKLPKLGKYYAVLSMDGDRMGEWIAGTSTAEIVKTINPEYLEQWALSKPKEYESFLKKLEFVKVGRKDDIPKATKPISAAIHREISRRLSAFAVKEVKRIVEVDHYGKVVYAGGDDVLAFVPLMDIFDVMEELRQTFSKEEYMGKNATVRIGAVIAHYEESLSMVLEETRNAEKLSKDLGRNRFTIEVIKRSGVTRIFTLPWYEEGNSSIDLLKFITDLFKEKIISSNFAFELEERGFKKFPKEILGKEFNFILKRNLLKKDFVLDGEALFERIYKLLEKNPYDNFDDLLEDIIEIFILGRFLAKEEED